LRKIVATYRRFIEMAKNDDALDILWGAGPIGAYIGLPEHAVYHGAANGTLPVFKLKARGARKPKLGARKSELNARLRAAKEAGDGS
jgi:hypothetical protein